MKKNPFTLTFGTEPPSYIHRGLEVQEIIDTLQSENPAYRVCMITGVRGSGKTVSLASIAEEFSRQEDWIVIELNPLRDLLGNMAAELSNRQDIVQIFKNAKINLSFLGLGIDIDGVPPITDTAVALNEMLKALTKKKKKILVTIDEVTSNENMHIFTSQFQMFMRKKYNVFLLITGLYENIQDLQDEKNLTFLYRAPKVILKPLNLLLIASNYQKIFTISAEDAKKMAQLTMGYAFAYQALGFLCFKYEKSYKDILLEYDACLQEYVYEKIYSELSNKDRHVLNSMANVKSTKIIDIRNEAKMDSNIFNLYKTRLIKKGILHSKEYGHLQWALPRFKEYVIQQNDMYLL